MTRLAHDHAALQAAARLSVQCMGTTVELSDRLYRRLRAAASERGALCSASLASRVTTVSV